MKIKLKFSILEIAYWCSYCSFISFIALYFVSKNVNEAQIGIYLSVYMYFGLIGQFVFGWLSDVLHSHKKMIILLNILLVPIYIVLYYFNSNFIIIMALLGLTNIPLPALIDSWILNNYQETPQIYGEIRSSASLIFAFYAAIFGICIDKIGLWIMPSVAILWIILTLYIAATLKEKNIVLHKEKGSIKNILNSKYFLSILPVFLVIGISVGGFQQLQIFVIKSIGGDVKYLGIAFFVSAIVQFPILYYYQRLGKLTVELKLAVGLASYIISFVIIYFAKNMYLYLFAITLNGVGFAILLPTIREFTFIYAPQSLRTFSLSLVDAIQNSLGSCIGILVGGSIVKSYGTKMMVLNSLLLSLLALIIFFIVQAVFNKRKGDY